MSHFDWRLKESTCVATITTTQTLLRFGATGAAPAASGTGKPATPAKGAGPPCVPGAPARVGVFLRRALAAAALERRQQLHDDEAARGRVQPFSTQTAPQ